jgi:hypothetical protein
MDWPRDRARPGMIDWVSPWHADLFRPRELGEGEGGGERTSPQPRGGRGRKEKPRQE